MDGGRVFMLADSYGFSSRFGWLADRFGLSWQSNHPG
ncbi:VOC family protein [Algicella marina]|nr:VOC family protein [Algicella marina]